MFTILERQALRADGHHKSPAGVVLGGVWRAILGTGAGGWACRINTCYAT